MKRTSFIILIVFCFAAVITVPVSANVQQTKTLSAEATISLLKSSPNDAAIYGLYGHAAIRVNDPGTGYDRVFNYGIYNFSEPNFLYRFVKGETDYKLQAIDFIYCMLEFTSIGCEVYEVVLNLLPEEKDALLQALIKNELPENCVYRYNFFFDNCSTRPITMIENNIRGSIKYEPQSDTPTFREAIYHCTRYHPWTTLGCDLIMGLPADRAMTQKETFFLPMYLLKAVETAEVVRENSTQPLKLQVNILSDEKQEPKHAPPFITTPLACFSLLLLIVVFITRIEWRKRKYYRLVDCTLFFMAGAAGCIMYFLSFFSVHPGMFPNISLLWLHPFHFIGVFFFLVKKFNKMAYWYHCINFTVILVMVVSWFFVPQHFNPAFIPLIATLWLRSGWAIVRKMI